MTVSPTYNRRVSMAVFMPIHTVAIVAMGIHLLDNLDLDELSVACAEAGRWSFLLAVGSAGAAPGHRLPGESDRRPLVRHLTS